jgi:hypothetical protein
MNDRVKQTLSLVVVASFSVMATASIASNASTADCGHAQRPDAARVVPGAEPRSDAAVALSDPALDGMFARYAGLHRDTVGYAMTDVIDSSMLAKAAQESALPSTH